jgi:hypothetical protein
MQHKSGRVHTGLGALNTWVDWESRRNAMPVPVPVLVPVPVIVTSHIRDLVMGTANVPETSAVFKELTRLTARDNFIDVSNCERLIHQYIHWGCLSTGYWGEYMDLRGRKWQEAGEDCKIRSFITCIFQLILLRWYNGGEWNRRGM